MTVDQPSEAQQHLDELRDAVLDDWLILADHVTRTQRAMEQTLSWRVTKPLRLARTFQLKSAEIGVLPASRLAAVAVAQRLGRSA